MSDNAIRLTEGDALTYTITLRRDGSAEDISGGTYTVTFYAHDDEAAFGTNKVDGLSCSITDGANGVVTATFTTTHTTFTSDRDFRGRWALKVEESGASSVEWTKQEPFYIVRNPFVVEG